MESRANGALPVIAVAMGDPSGISPELTARILVEPDLRHAARYVVFGDKRLLDLGARMAGSIRPSSVIRDGDAIPSGADKPVFIDLANHDPADLQRGTATLAGGKAATGNFRRALQFAASGQADAVFFTPFNKAAMRFAYPGYDDEIRFVRDAIGFEGPASEFNVLDKLWNARVTSHIPLSEVAAEHHAGAHPAGADAGRRQSARRRLQPAAHRGRGHQSLMPAMAAISAATRSRRSSRR
jgi:4-hydroxythreonine-4-phosphate dehydrogenase